MHCLCFWNLFPDGSWKLRLCSWGWSNQVGSVFCNSIRGEIMSFQAKFWSTTNSRPTIYFSGILRLWKEQRSSWRGRTWRGKRFFLSEIVFSTTLDIPWLWFENPFCFQELENNPMRLLEERTAASKHEMDLAESLEELKELNRRCDFLISNLQWTSENEYVIKLNDSDAERLRSTLRRSWTSWIMGDLPKELKTRRSQKMKHLLRLLSGACKEWLPHSYHWYHTQERRCGRWEGKENLGELRQQQQQWGRGGEGGYRC